jgi:Icc-related predicted phosphoesterase
MKILAVTDIHGAYTTLREILGAEKFLDAVVIGGDLTTFGSRKEAEDVVTGLAIYGAPLVTVAGNMDPSDIDAAFDELGLSINGKGRIIAGVGFFGVSGAPLSPLHTPNEITEQEILARAERGWKDVKEAALHVFVPHSPPLNTSLDRIRSGKHVGSSAVREFIERAGPAVVVCGHIHEARGVEQLGRSTVVNCGPAADGCYAVLDLQDGVSVDLKRM